MINKIKNKLSYSKKIFLFLKNEKDSISFQINLCFGPLFFQMLKIEILVKSLKIFNIISI